MRTIEAGPNTWGRVANSLEDLTRRENRIAHDVSGAYPTAGHSEPAVSLSLFWRGLLVPQGSVADDGLDGGWGVAGVDDDGNGATDDVSEAGHFGSDDLTRPHRCGGAAMPPSLPGRAYAESYGSDVMLAEPAGV